MSIVLVDKQFNFKFYLLLYLNALWFMLHATLRNINNKRDFFFIFYLCYLNKLQLKELVSHSFNLCIKLLCAKCIQLKKNFDFVNFEKNLFNCDAIFTFF